MKRQVQSLLTTLRAIVPIVDALPVPQFLMLSPTLDDKGGAFGSFFVKK